MTKIILIQPTDNVLGADALIPGLQRDLEHTMSRSNTTEGSKFGSITQTGTLTETITAGFLFRSGDEAQDELKRAMRKGLEVKIWIVDTEKNSNGRHNATFGYTSLGELSYTYPYEGVEEISTEMTIQIQSVDGEFAVLPDGIEDFARYGFETPGEYTGDHNNRTKTPISVTGVTLSPTTATIDVGDTVQLTAVVEPLTATTQTVSYSSSDDDVAIVDANGLVTGVDVGNATITVITTDGGFTATAAITVE
ncbi:phage major tail protein, TP901-1 family [Metasolibacillus meyeri]|uniref:phage major tail protein, TP901-1 family n=1 Tax=Metasolibacillus meyeri TaxID=1071052 RepID=UPI000D30FF0F|nr:phage major tail protein, TP901-1 family [Metasolibacillus meyeri]